MTLAAGAILAGRYQVVRLLGEGGFGAVYLAADQRLGGKLIALKENFDNSREAQEQFRLEAQLLANLQHNGLPHVTDYFIESYGRQFLIMDYIEGDDLDQRIIATGHPLSEREASNIMLQVCDAVAYLHTRRPQSIIHRDIKLPNIKITPGGQAILVDFGIAKIYHPTKGTVKVAKAVTPGFSPPEQYIGKTDTRSDVYALGATLYCLVCADPPPDAMERLTKNVTLTLPSQINPYVSNPLEQIILRAMALAPDQRFENANRLAAALRAFLAGNVTVTCPKCGYINRAGARFCSRDRTPLGSIDFAATASAISLDNQPSEMIFEAANKVAERENYLQAISYYNACLRKGFRHAAVYHNLGLSLLINKQASKAANILEKGNSLYPTDADICFLLGRAYNEMDILNKALTWANQACQLAPQESIYHMLYGRLLLKASNYSA